MSNESFRGTLRDEVREFATAPIDAKLWGRLEQQLYYLQGEFGDPATYTRLRELIEQVDQACDTGANVLYYLATPPSFFIEIVQRLGQEQLTVERDGRWRRVIVEKPFGHDLDSARALNRDIGQVLSESQVYRIDHYLGKETVQNIMAFRFANGIFEPIWNRRYVDHIQITVAETVGVEGRGGYYEEAGALRDMVQNHMFQLLALVAMEPPYSFEANSVRNERVKILHAIRPLTPENVLQQTVRGQYGDGHHDGERLSAYRSEPKVDPASAIETFVALKLFVENWRWADVPFYLRTGKRLPERVTEIAIQFRRAPLLLFRETNVDRIHPNMLVLRIQPDEGISLRFEAKVPGPSVQLGTVNMDFSYADYFGSTPSTGYETLLYDCMTADSTLFHRSDMVEAGWSVVTPILDVWKALPPRNFPNYASNTWGPKEADELIERDGRRWRDPRAR
jgi:glucose-6-phosphate 1-dehydrogenase